MSNVEETYKRTMQAEGVDVEQLVDVERDRSQQYTLSNETIKSTYDKNKLTCSQSNKTVEQTIDAFILALMEQGMPQDEAEEVAECFDRTDGDYFNMDDDEDDDDYDPDMPDEDDDDWDDDFEDDEEIIEV